MHSNELLPYSELKISETPQITDIQHEYEFYSPSDILNSQEELEWIVPGLIQRPCLGIAVGPSKLGKTTLMAKTAISVASGTTILEKPCKKSKVLYLLLEGGMGNCKNVFSKMGMNRTDGLTLLIKKPGNHRSPSEHLKRMIEMTGAEVIFIDSMILWERKFNENSYSEVYEVLRRYTDIASETNTSIIFTHHSAKSAMEGMGDGALGSTAWFGACDTKIQLLRINMVPHLKIDHRNDVAVEAKPIYINHDEGTISLLPPVFSQSEQRIKEEILQMLQDSPLPVKSSELMKIRGNDSSKIKVLKVLCTEGKVQQNPGSGTSKTITYSYVPKDAQLEDLSEYLESINTVSLWSEDELNEFAMNGGQCE